MPDTAAVIWWSAVLIGLLVVALVAVAQVKKRFMKPDETGSAGFTLADLRALHREGKMSDGEFERAKEVIVTAARKATERTPPPLKPSDPDKPNRLAP